MRIGRLLKLGLALAGTLGVGSAFTRGCAHDLVDGPLQQNYSRRPPEQAFERAFQRSVPIGVSDLRAAGKSWLAGTNIWMRFRATPAAIQELLAGHERLPASQECVSSHVDQWEAAGRHHYDPKNRLRWSELGEARRLETFSLLKDGGSGESAQGWLDRDTNTVYIFIFGI